MYFLGQLRPGAGQAAFHAALMPSLAATAGRSLGHGQISTQEPNNNSQLQKFRIINQSKVFLIFIVKHVEFEMWGVSCGRTSAPSIINSSSVACGNSRGSRHVDIVFENIVTEDDCQSCLRALVATHSPARVITLLPMCVTHLLVFPHWGRLCTMACVFVASSRRPLLRDYSCPESVGSADVSPGPGYQTCTLWKRLVRVVFLRGVTWPGSDKGQLHSPFFEHSYPSQNHWL